MGISKRDAPSDSPNKMHASLPSTTRMLKGLSPCALCAPSRLLADGEGVFTREAKVKQIRESRPGDEAACHRAQGSRRKAYYLVQTKFCTPTTKVASSGRGTGWEARG